MANLMAYQAERHSSFVSNDFPCPKASAFSTVLCSWCQHGTKTQQQAIL